ncbi:hypothetical protein [Streptomyces cupreus]|uniref:Uncharacterized protein n=1 Tax=Streptomyces cupreus TaxID=2759956 RepID=A0A7X1MBE3_9ACTN|nr:hypothetical protein [Streptomyces cupreus]MBC2904761.1 hypothetical protein [Streptomyces cupreus]
MNQTFRCPGYGQFGSYGVLPLGVAERLLATGGQAVPRDVQAANYGLWAVISAAL